MMRKETAFIAMSKMEEISQRAQLLVPAHKSNIGLLVFTRIQENISPYNKLSLNAQLKSDVKDIATQCHQENKSKAGRATAHTPSTHRSISILKTRFFGNLNEYLQYHLNGAICVDTRNPNING